MLIANSKACWRNSEESKFVLALCIITSGGLVYTLI
jgi:hypothetical protein